MYSLKGALLLSDNTEYGGSIVKEPEHNGYKGLSQRQKKWKLSRKQVLTNKNFPDKNTLTFFAKAYKNKAYIHILWQNNCVKLHFTSTKEI